MSTRTTDPPTPTPTLLGSPPSLKQSYAARMTGRGSRPTCRKARRASSGPSSAASDRKAQMDWGGQGGRGAGLCE